jgi:hypothetical protein
MEDNNNNEYINTFNGDGENNYNNYDNNNNYYTDNDKYYDDTKLDIGKMTTMRITNDSTKVSSFKSPHTNAKLTTTSSDKASDISKTRLIKSDLKKQNSKKMITNPSTTSINKKSYHSEYSTYTENGNTLD